VREPAARDDVPAHRRIGQQRDHRQQPEHKQTDKLQRQHPWPAQMPAGRAEHQVDQGQYRQEVRGEAGRRPRPEAGQADTDPERPRPPSDELLDHRVMRQSSHGLSLGSAARKAYPRDVID
jgi:hypothetical protein